MADLEKFMGLGPDDEDLFITQDNASAYYTAKRTIALAKHTSMREIDPDGLWMYKYPANGFSPWDDQALEAVPQLRELAMSEFKRDKIQVAISEINQRNESKVFSQYQPEELEAANHSASDIEPIVSKLDQISYSVFDDPRIFHVAMLRLYEAGDRASSDCYQFWDDLETGKNHAGLESHKVDSEQSQDVPFDLYVNDFMDLLIFQRALNWLIIETMVGSIPLKIPTHTPCD